MSKIEKITQALDELESLTVQWIYEFDGWIATTFRQYPVYSQQGPAQQLHHGVVQTDDPAYNTYFGPQHPYLAPGIVGAGVLAGIIGVVYSIWNRKHEQKLASTNYFMQQIQKIYKDVDEKTPAENELEKDFDSDEIKEGSVGADGTVLKPQRVNKKYAYKTFAKTCTQLQRIAQSNGVDKKAKDLLKASGVRKKKDEDLTALENLVTEYQDLHLVYDCLYGTGFSRGLRKWHQRKRLSEEKYQALLNQDQKTLEKNLKEKFKEVRDALYKRTGNPNDWNNDLANPIKSAKARMTKLYNDQLTGTNGVAPLADIDLELKFNNGKWIADLEFKERNGIEPVLKPGQFKIPARLDVPENEEKPLHDKMDELTVAPPAQRIWKAGFGYSYAYWIAWFIVWAITAATCAAGGLSIALTFGIAAIVPGIALTWAIGKWVHKKLDYLIHPYKKAEDIEAARLAKEQAEIDKANYEKYHLFKKSMLSACYNNERRQEIKAKNYQLEQFAQRKEIDIELKTPNVPEYKPDFNFEGTYAYPEPVNDLESKWSKWGRIARTAVSNVCTGYILTFFFFWPFQDLAATLVSSDTLLKLGLGILDPYGLLVESIVAGLGLAIGLVFAVYNGSKEHKAYIDEKQLIAKKEDILTTLSEQLQIRDKLLEESNRLNQVIKNLLKEFDQKNLTAEEKKAYQDFFKPAQFIPDIHENDKVWKHYDPKIATSKWEKAKSFVDGAFNFVKRVVFDGGTGSLLVRTVFQFGCVAGTALVGSTFWPVGLTMACLWASFKLYEAYKQKQLRHQQTYVNEAEARLHEVAKENHALKEQIAVQKKQVELLKGLKHKKNGETEVPQNGRTHLPKPQLPNNPNFAKVSAKNLFEKVKMVPDQRTIEVQSKRVTPAAA